ncbi:MAG: hypothetical protein Q7S92_02275 [Candidatus Diapherotrites archaeon]|nr:hypothetical protein [Candidatus Diapherotrites archaeon]
MKPLLRKKPTANRRKAGGRLSATITDRGTSGGRVSAQVHYISVRNKGNRFTTHTGPAERASDLRAFDRFLKPHELKLEKGRLVSRGKKPLSYEEVREKSERLTQGSLSTQADWNPKYGPGSRKKTRK